LILYTNNPFLLDVKTGTDEALAKIEELKEKFSLNPKNFKLKNRKN